MSFFVRKQFIFGSFIFFVCVFFLPSFSRVSSQEESVANLLIVGFWKSTMSQIGYTCGFGQWSPIIKFTKNYHNGVKIFMKLQLDYIENKPYIMQLPLVFIFWDIRISKVIRTVILSTWISMRIIWVVGGQRFHSSCSLWKQNNLCYTKFK